MRLKSEVFLRPEDTLASLWNMQLTDPPTWSATAFFCVGAGDPLVNYGYKPVRDVEGPAQTVGHGVTLGDLIIAANHDSIPDSADVWSKGDSVPLQDETLTGVVAKVKEVVRKPIYIQPQHTNIFLDSMVVPSDVEWESVKKYESQETRAQ